MYLGILVFLPDEWRVGDITAFIGRGHWPRLLEQQPTLETLIQFHLI